MARKKSLKFRRNKNTSSQPLRVDKEFTNMILRVKAKAMMNGRQPPTSATITKKITRVLKREGLVDQL